MSTHDLELALQMADRLWLMAKNGAGTETAKGGVIAGTQEQLAQDGTLERFFARKGITFKNIEGHYRPVITE